MGDDYDVSLRLYEKHFLTVVLNATYHVPYGMPDPQHLTVTSRSTRIGEVKDPDSSYIEEVPLGNDSGFLWRLNSYWRLRRPMEVCTRAVKLSRFRATFRLGWVDAQGFSRKFPKESMVNTLRGTRAAVENLK